MWADSEIAKASAGLTIAVIKGLLILKLNLYSLNIKEFHYNLHFFRQFMCRCGDFAAVAVREERYVVSSPDLPSVRGSLNTKYSGERSRHRR
jgi:hypothetical protein